MSKLASFHLSSTLSLGTESTGANPIGTRRHLNFSLLIFLCDTTRHSSSDSAKYFRKSRSSAPVIIKPIKIQYSPCLFGLGAPVEWCKCITDFAYCLVPDLLACPSIVK
ncbi:hypothetical protein MJO28_008631 [Puccinia striiformis f. sp. tritici]|uniref:Uncharacterized protein n=1 Tax=Puccinia striiformis f. sp. tritici TaxID=168172 RepID=A0ACC0EEE7_9BASI|nr:hypothetical protein MJO28_008631 [Puccinia striiformis f. sp. tritici]